MALIVGWCLITKSSMNEGYRNLVPMRYNYGASNYYDGVFGMPLHSTIHVKLGKNGYQSFKPPSAHGEYGCTQVPCPKKYDDNMVCWACCSYH